MREAWRHRHRLGGNDRASSSASSAMVIGGGPRRTRLSCGGASIIAQSIIWSLTLRPCPGVRAITANPNPIFVHDEHGNLHSRPIYFRGDGTYHWYEDPNGYTLIDDPGFTIQGNKTRKVYARIDPRSGHLVSTGVRFTSSSSNATINGVDRMGLQKHLKPSINVRKAMCGQFCEDDGDRYFSQNSSFTKNRAGRKNYRRKLQEEHVNRRKLVSSANNNNDALRNLVILIRFANHQERVLPNASDYDVLLNGPGGEGTLAPTGSVNDVFLSNSYGLFYLNSTIYPWVTVSMPESYYADGSSGTTGTQIFEAIHEVLNVIDSDPSIDLSEFNTDFNQGDGYIDAITVIHSGFGAEFGGVDCDGAKESDRIWSHSWFMTTGDWTSQDGTVSVSRYHINPGLWGVCGSNISRIGVIAHETAHFLGLPDLYDPVGGYGIGIYDLMSDSWGIDGSQLYPPLLSPWSKIMLGWMTPTTIVNEGDFELRQSWQYPDVYRIDLGSSESEYLLIENRQPGSYDILYPLGGLAIWHIDDNYAYSFGNLRDGYPGQYNWPANGNHYHVALLQADGKYDLERGHNQGDYSDLFRYDYFFGVDHLFPSASDPMLGPFPNTDSYAFGVVKRSNHFISGISATGPSMSFSFLPSSPCQPGEIHFSLALVTDEKGNEVSWALLETYTGSIALSGNGYTNNEQTNVGTCLPTICYTFVINDTGNDGLCCAFGDGGFVVRINGVKVAIGNEFGSTDEHDLPCIRPPTSSPTTATPTASVVPTASPTEIPSRVPTFAPTLIPTVACGGGEGRLTVSADINDQIQWNVHDLFGRLVMTSNNGRISECIDWNSCYTVSFHNSMNDEFGASRMYTVTYDDAIIFSGKFMPGDHTTMIGHNCLGNGDDVCTSSSGVSTPMSMFRLELASESGMGLKWNLLNGTMHEVLSAGPFGDCDVNTFALCLPRMDCYEFTMLNNSTNNATGSFTVLFSQINESMIQNYTGTVDDTSQPVFLGTCYHMNFNR